MQYGSLSFGELHTGTFVETMYKLGLLTETQVQKFRAKVMERYVLSAQLELEVATEKLKRKVAMQMYGDGNDE